MKPWQPVPEESRSGATEAGDFFPGMQTRAIDPVFVTAILQVEPILEQIKDLAPIKAEGVVLGNLLTRIDAIRNRIPAKRPDDVPTASEYGEIAALGLVLRLLAHRRAGASDVSIPIDP